MALTLVLSVGLDPALLATRNLVLESAGYTAVSAHSVKEAVDRFQEGDFDLVLLCQSIPRMERDGLADWVRASGSRIPLVSISGNLCEDHDFTGVTVGSEPGALLWGIREVLINATTRAAEMPASRPQKGAGVLPLNKVAAAQEVAAAQGRKPPQSAAGHEQRARTIKGRFIPLADAG